MAKSFLNGFINSIAKSVDKAIASGKKSNNPKQIFVKKGTVSRLPDSDKFDNVYFNSSDGNVSGNLKFKINGSDYIQPFSGNYKKKKSNDRWSNTNDRFAQKTAELKRQNKEWAKQFSRLNKLYSSATAKEKTNIKAAIEKHKEVIEFAEDNPDFRYNQYARSVNRLIILYRKSKDYYEEILLINKYSPNDPKLIIRLSKAKELLAKSK